MMIFYLFFICTCIWCRRTSAFDTVKLRAVSSFPGLHQFYSDIREDDRARILPYEQTDDAPTKLEVCHSIFSSFYFDMNGEDPVPLNSKETYSELREKYPKLFRQLYGDGASTSKNVFKRYHSFKLEEKPSKYYDQNHYQKREVWVGGYPTKETVFSCLTRVRRTKQIKQYFVSNLYNVSKRFYSPSASSACFVFALDKRDDLVIHALAEETAKAALTTHTIERLYFHKRQTLKPARVREDDPICQLSREDKLRLCNQVLSASEFEDLLIFHPKFVNVLGHCEKRRVSFAERDVRARARNAVFEEWMMGCKILLTPENVVETLYISTGYSDSGVFLYTKIDENNFYMIYYTSNTSVGD